MKNVSISFFSYNSLMDKTRLRNKLSVPTFSLKCISTNLPNRLLLLLRTVLALPKASSRGLASTIRCSIIPALCPWEVVKYLVTNKTDLSSNFVNNY